MAHVPSASTTPTFPLGAICVLDELLPGFAHGEHVGAAEDTLPRVSTAPRLCVVPLRSRRTTVMLTLGMRPESDGWPQWTFPSALAFNKASCFAGARWGAIAKGKMCHVNERRPQRAEAPRVLSLLSGNGRRLRNHPLVGLGWKPLIPGVAKRQPLLKAIQRPYPFPPNVILETNEQAGRWPRAKTAVFFAGPEHSKKHINVNFGGSRG